MIKEIILNFFFLKIERIGPEFILNILHNILCLVKKMKKSCKGAPPPNLLLLFPKE